LTISVEYIFLEVPEEFIKAKDKFISHELISTNAKRIVSRGGFYPYETLAIVMV